MKGAGVTRAPMIVGLLVMAAAWHAWAGVPAVHAQTPGEPPVVEGQVINGTADGGGVSGLTAQFHQVTATRDNIVNAVTDLEGRFSFEGVAFDPAAVYGVSVDYQGALYATDVDFSEGSTPPLVVTVYDATNADSSLTVSAASLLLAQVDKETQTLWVLEIVNVRNDTDKTHVPGPDPMSLLRFGLPPGADGLGVDTSLLGGDVIQVDRGFALTASVPPGEHQVMYEYHFPYQGSEAQLAKSFPYGAASVRVLTPYEVVRISSQQLGAPEVVTIEGRPYQLLRGSDLSRDSRITLDLLGLPRASFMDRMERRLEGVRWEYVAPAGLGLLMVALMGFALRRRNATRETHIQEMVDGETLEVERKRIVHQLAELDDSIEGGTLSEGQYRRRREGLTARLDALTKRPLAHSD